MQRHLLSRVFKILTGILLGFAIVVFAVRRGPSGLESAPSEGAAEEAEYFLPDPIPAPPISLLSHRGELFNSVEKKDGILAVFFGYTSCPDVCPLTLSHLSQAFREMGEEGDRIQVVLITVDPARDTPQRLQEYLGSFHPSFLGLTGTEEEIRAVADRFGAFFARSGEGENYTVDHTARTFVIGSSGQISLTFPVTATPQEMARDFTVLLGEG